MTIVAADPGLNFNFAFLFLIPFAVGVVLLCVFEDWKGWNTVGFVLAMVGSMGTILYSLVVMPDLHQDQVNENLVAALEEAGYANLDVDSTKGAFVGSLNGEYVKGTLTDEPGDYWTVQHLTDPKG